MQAIKIGDRSVGPGQPVYVIAEIGINHNGDLDIAKQAHRRRRRRRLRRGEVPEAHARRSACPDDQRDQIRETPWGEMTYLDYRYRVEFEHDEYAGDRRATAGEQGIQWFASPWDEPSVDFIEQFERRRATRSPRRRLTDDELLAAMADTGKPVILSTGMSTIEEIDHAVEVLGTDNADPAAHHAHLPAARPRS